MNNNFKLLKSFNITIFRPTNIDMFNELDRVAALISECDIVIGPMTAVISMAGAVGTKCYGLSLHGLDLSRHRQATLDPPHDLQISRPF